MPPSVVRVLAEAAGEIWSAEEYYRKRSVDAADGFMAEVQRALAVVAEAPLRWPVVRQDVRRFVMRRYPYSIVYYAENEFVYVLAVAHAKRRPFYWLKRRGR